MIICLWYWRMSWACCSSLKHSMYRQVLVLKTPVFDPHGVFMHLEICVHIELKTIDLSVFFKECQCVYCEVGLNVLCVNAKTGWKLNP